MKRILSISISISVLLAIAVVLTAASNPKTTGDSGWTNPYCLGGGLICNPEAHTTFNAIATTPTGTGAKGSLLYDDGNITYTMDVQFLKVSGNKAWFAGPVTSVSGHTAICCALGNYIFYEIVDNGEPGVGHDQIYGEDLGTSDAAVALSKVTSKVNPIGGPFTINDGNMQVH